MERNNNLDGDGVAGQDTNKVEYYILPSIQCYGEVLALARHKQQQLISNVSPSGSIPMRMIVIKFN